MTIFGSVCRYMVAYSRANTPIAEMMVAKKKKRSQKCREISDDFKMRPLIFPQMKMAHHSETQLTNSPLSAQTWRTELKSGMEQVQLHDIRGIINDLGVFSTKSSVMPPYQLLFR